MMTTRVIVNIAELTTNDAAFGDGTPSGRIVDAAMVLDDHHVLWVGSNADAPDADERIDAGDCAVIPGFVDSHTHLVFAGERSDEFEARMAGQRYDGEASREASRRRARRRVTSCATPHSVASTHYGRAGSRRSRSSPATN